MGVVPFPHMIRVFLYHHQTSGHSHLPLGSPVQHVSIAAPPQHREGHVAFKRAKRLRRVRDVEAQAHAGAQVEEAMLRDPLPQHAARGPLAVLQHQVRAIRRDAAFQRFTLQDEQALLWKEKRGENKEEEDEMRGDRKERRGAVRDMGGKMRNLFECCHGDCLGVAMTTGV